MSREEIVGLLQAHRENQANSQSLSFHGPGVEIKREDIQGYIEGSIAMKLEPERVLEALFETAGESKNESRMVSETIKQAVRALTRMNFDTLDRARSFAHTLRRTIPKVAGLKTSFRIMDRAFRYAMKEEFATKVIVSEELLNLIPPIFEKLSKEESEITLEGETATCAEFCQKWLDEALKVELPDFVVALVIDIFTDMPLNEEQVTTFVDSIMLSAKFGRLPEISEHLLPKLREFPKLLIRCLHRIIETALDVEIADADGRNLANRRTQCSLIKTLCNVSSNTKAVFDAMVKLLTSTTELPTHFTPFLVSLCFNISKLSNDKIREVFHKLFIERLKDDATRTRSRFLSHIYAHEGDTLVLMELEKVMSLAVDMAQFNLEGNISRFVEFAFNIVDSAATPGLKKDIINMKESTSRFIPYQVRQVNIGVQILRDCIDSLRTVSSEIYRKIVERVITNSPNSIYLIQCLDSPEHLLEVIDYIQYLELPVVEQLMRFAVPKISGDEGLLNRAVIAARKAFFNRTDKSKLNGLAALFYLIQPRQEQTFTQYSGASEDFGGRIGAAADEDLQQDIFNLMKRGFTQGDVVQADLYFFIPFLIQQNPGLAPIICDTFKEKLESILHEDGFPLEIRVATPHFLHCISRCLRLHTKGVIEQKEWGSLGELFNQTCESVSRVEFEYLMDTADIFAHPDQRECVIAIINVMFNHSFLVNKDVALDLFRLHDRITRKKSEIDRLRKDNDLKSNLHFPCFMELASLKQLFRFLAEDDGDYSGNYGIQLYALQTTKDMIAELSELRLEMRSLRLKRVLTLGQLLFDSFSNVKWADAPAGTKTNSSLVEMLTTQYRQLFVFVFETYDTSHLETFLQKSSLIAPQQKISDAQIILLQRIKQNIRNQLTINAANFCVIAEHISLLCVFDEKYFATVNKATSSLIHQNSPFAGRAIRLTKAFAPKSDLHWLGKVVEAVVTKLTEDESGSLCSALMETISTITSYLEEVQWGIRVWIRQVHASHADQAGNFAAKFSTYLRQLVSMTDQLLTINFKNFPPNYYESMVRFLNDLYKEVNRLLKQTLLMPRTCNEELEVLVRVITSEFDEKVIQFTIRNQVNVSKHTKVASRQEKFDATYVPLLHFNVEKVRATTKTLIEKRLFDEDLTDSYCRIRGMDIKFPNRGKKKKGKHEDLDEEAPVAERDVGHDDEHEEDEGEEDQDSINEDE